MTFQIKPFEMQWTKQKKHHKQCNQMLDAKSSQICFQTLPKKYPLLIYFKVTFFKRWQKYALRLGSSVHTDAFYAVH